MERFESLINNVDELIMKGYDDPDEYNSKLEILAKTGNEEHVYEFIGPGVSANIFNRLNRRNMELSEENEKLKEEDYILRKDFSERAMEIKKLKQENKEIKKENEEFSNQILEYIEMNNRLRREKEEREVSAVAAKEKNKLLEIENEKLKQMNDDLEQERESLLKENDKLRYSFDDLSEENKKLRKRIDALKGRKESTSREDILDKAKECVCGQREQDYGSPESNFQLIADLWNGYLGNTLSKEKRDFEKELGVTHKHKELSVPWEISAMDVSMMMALLKIARIRNGGGSGDSFVDLAGYAACGGEIWHGERHSDK